MKRLRLVLRLLLCVVLAVGGPTHAGPRSTPLPAESARVPAPCHEAMMETHAGTHAGTYGKSVVPRSHDCCGPDDCRCGGAPGGLAWRATPVVLVRSIRRVTWTVAPSATYLSPSVDSSLRPPIA